LSNGSPSFRSGMFCAAPYTQPMRPAACYADDEQRKLGV
jgi:hypothetical protein